MIPEKRTRGVAQRMHLQIRDGSDYRVGRVARFGAPAGEEARVLGEETRRRLSGHGFSTERREERRLSRSEFADLRKQSSGGSKGEGPFGRRTKSAKGRHGAKRRLEGGKRSFLPPRSRWGNERADEPNTGASPGVNRDRTRPITENEMLTSPGRGLNFMAEYANLDFNSGGREK